MNTKNINKKTQEFFEAYVESKEGKIIERSDNVFKVAYPNDACSKEYTYKHAIAREKKIPLIAPGSASFQQILRECSENGVLCQISLAPKDGFETLLKTYFKDSHFTCQDCQKATVDEETFSICLKPDPGYHQINNAKIISVKTIKSEPMRFFKFYFSATFQNKLRSKNEEIITILLDEKGNSVNTENENLTRNETLKIQDTAGKLKDDVFKKLKNVADEKISAILKEKVALFDLTISKEKKDRLRNFKKRLKRERREHVISKRHNFDYLKWQANYEALLKREEESFITNISVKFVNLLVINTPKVRAEISLDNNSTIQASFILGITKPLEVTCPLCKQSFIEGYATKDHFYVCKNCIRQSIDTGKIYSTKAQLTLDESLHEYIERDSGFICSVCGKRHSKLLEFKCSHDNSSVCINHYELCDVCGKVFSKLNLSYTDEFRRQLCPKHAVKNKSKEP